MNEILSGKDWHTLLSSSNIEDNWSTFRAYFPVWQINLYLKLTQLLTSVPWWSTALSKALDHCLHDFQIYAKQRNLVKSKIRFQHNYEEH